MISDIKAELLKNPDKIIELLEHFEFAHITTRHTSNGPELRFARNEDGGQNIRIKLENNEYLTTRDFVKNIKADLFSFVAQEKGISFRDVLRYTKSLLNLSDDWRPRKRELFGGIYSRISRKDAEIYAKTYPEEIMDNYVKIGNVRWLKDGISLATQKKFDVAYDDSTQRICLPIRNQYGEIVCVKGRLNDEPTDENPKYLYVQPGLASTTLYGFSENYTNLYEDTVLIGESEKFVLQLDTMGYHNGVALMSNSLSTSQAKMILSLNPKRVVFMLDNGLDLSITKQNAEMLKSFCTMREISIEFWDWRGSLDTEDKDSPTDHGKEIFDYILENEIYDIKELEGQL